MVKHYAQQLALRLVSAFFANPTGEAPASKALAALEKEDRAVGAQGIVVAGALRGECRILNNTITGFLMGIHVGHSAHSGVYRSARTLIAGNTVLVYVNGYHWTDRHGVFTGNSENTIVENNIVRVDRTPMALLLPVEGFRSWGVFGPMLVLRQNHTLDCTVGVRVRALNPGSQSASVWRVYDNAVRGTLTPFDVVPPMP
jgi:hypothetical protein